MPAQERITERVTYRFLWYVGDAGIGSDASYASGPS